VIFYLFNVDLNDESKNVNSSNNLNYNDLKNGLLQNNTSLDVHHYNQNNNNELMTNMRHDNNFLTQFMPGPPFVFGSLMVVCAILVAIFIKEEQAVIDAKRTSIVGERKSKFLVLVFLFL
jgi:preprotein translocase subunit SecG